MTSKQIPTLSLVVGATEVIVVHERIADALTRDLHEQGWTGCLDGLEEYLGAQTDRSAPS